MEQRQMRLVNLIEFWTYSFIPFLQDVQSVNQDGLCMGNRGFGSVEQIKMVSAWETEGMILLQMSVSAKSNCFIFWIIPFL